MTGPLLPNGYAVGNNITTVGAAAHYLDGVPFVLSSQCSMGTDQVNVIGVNFHLSYNDGNVVT